MPSPIQPTSNNNNMLSCGAVVVIAFILIAMLAYYFYNDNNSKDNTDNNACDCCSSCSLASPYPVISNRLRQCEQSTASSKFNINDPGRVHPPVQVPLPGNSRISLTPIEINDAINMVSQLLPDEHVTIASISPIDAAHSRALDNGIAQAGIPSSSVSNKLKIHRIDGSQWRIVCSLTGRTLYKWLSWADASTHIARLLQPKRTLIQKGNYVYFIWKREGSSLADMNSQF